MSERAVTKLWPYVLHSYIWSTHRGLLISDVSGPWPLLQCHLLAEMTKNFSCLFFVSFLQKIQRHKSTGAAARVQRRLLRRVWWIQSSPWSDRGHHGDVCSVGLKDQHPLSGNTRVQGTVWTGSLGLLRSRSNTKRWTDHIHGKPNATFFFLVIFSAYGGPNTTKVPQV